jgi:hypothetical protein
MSGRCVKIVSERGPSHAERLEAVSKSGVSALHIHRNPVKRGLVAKPEDWLWSSFRHYASGVKGTVEIESQWTAFRRGSQLPVGDRLRQGKRSCFPTQAAKDAAWMGHNPSRENQK